MNDANDRVNDMMNAATHADSPFLMNDAKD
jgi:hypothetical protein